MAKHIVVYAATSQESLDKRGADRRITDTLNATPAYLIGWRQQGRHGSEASPVQFC